VAAMGVSLTDFYTMLIEEALDAVKK
jgi:hypothetical protein